MTIVLALDIALRCGWACDSHQPGVPRSSTFRAPSTIAGADGGVDRGASFLGFHTWLRSQIIETKAQALVYEAPMVTVGNKTVARNFGTSDATIRLLHGFQAIAEACAESAAIPCYEKAVSSVRKHFCGSGRADKQQVMMRCRQLGWVFVDDNAADALALWSLAKSLIDPHWQPAQFALLYDRNRK